MSTPASNGASPHRTPTRHHSLGQHRNSASPTGSNPSTHNGGDSLHGTTLLVDGMATERHGSASSSFRSGVSIADAHIKACSMQFNASPEAYKRGLDAAAAQRQNAVPFASSTSSDRDAHYKGLLNGSYGAPRSSGSPNQAKSQRPSAVFSSKSPSACAHINALPKPTDPTYLPRTGSGRLSPSASFKSGTSVGDAHIKALSSRFGESSVSGSPKAGMGTVKGGPNAVFLSTTPIADAHIRALPKPADICVAYRATD